MIERLSDLVIGRLFFLAMRRRGPLVLSFTKSLNRSITQFVPNSKRL